MSAPMFKIGDRVRSGDSVGTVDEINETGSWLRISGRDKCSTWFMWTAATECDPAPPMSPEAKMVWHAMRAGAKRIGRFHWSSTDGTTYRTHKYEDPSCNRVYLRVDVALPPLAEDEAGR